MVEAPRQIAGVSVTRCEEARLVENGDVFTECERLILAAEESIHLGMYIWRPGRASARIEAALARRRPGVPCRVLVDPYGSRGGFFRSVRRRLESLGCEVRPFRQTWPHRPAKGLLYRYHRKLLVVDGRVGLTGGFCIRDEWLGNGARPDEWRDVNLRLSGPVVGQMQTTFASDWTAAGGAPIRAESSLPRAGEIPAVFVSNRFAERYRRPRTLIESLFESAKRRLWIRAGYFVPDEPLIRLLHRVAARGVDVRLLVPGDIHDVPPARSLQRSSYHALTSRGVRLWEYLPAMMHAKTVVVDDSAALVGSVNLGPGALRVLAEGAALLWEPSLAARLASGFLGDLERAEEIREPPRRRLRAALRSLAWRCAEWLAPAARAP